MYKYSDRLAWSVQPNAFSGLLTQKRASGIPLLDLTISNPTEALADYPHKAIAEAYRVIPDFTYNPDPLGTKVAREQIAFSYADRGITISPAHLALTASTSEAYGLLFKLLVNSGENVLIPTPSYPLFEYLAKLDGVELRPYRLLYDGAWHIDFESLQAAISNQTRAIILVNPNNPTGSFLKQDEWRRLQEIALKNQLPVIADEVFMDYAFAESPERVNSLIGQNDVLSFSLNGLSKSAGMPQMKLGWIAVSGPAAERNRALDRLALLLDSYLSVSTPVQNALPQLLWIGDSIRHEILKHLQANRKMLEFQLQSTQLNTLHCEGGWTAALRVPNVWTEEAWITTLLKEESVVVQPGYFFDMPMDGSLLVSLLTPPDIFSEGIRRLTSLAQTA